MPNVEILLKSAIPDLQGVPKAGRDLYEPWVSHAFFCFALVFEIIAKTHQFWKTYN